MYNLIHFKSAHSSSYRIKNTLYFSLYQTVSVIIESHNLLFYSLCVIASYYINQCTSIVSIHKHLECKFPAFFYDSIEMMVVNEGC